MFPSGRAPGLFFLPALHEIGTDGVDARLILVFYDKDGKVTAFGKNDVAVTAQGMAVGGAGMTQNVEAGSYAKVFLWNKSTLQPLTIH